MRLSQLFGSRFKERPADAVLDSHALLLRGGYFRSAANGIFTLLPPGARVLRNIEHLLSSAFDALGAQEIRLPFVLPPGFFGDGIGPIDGESPATRLSDRSGNPLALAALHDAAAVATARNELKSYAQFPCLLYGVQTKFRDETRSRGGLMRAREFASFDVFSFAATAEQADASYRSMLDAAKGALIRLGLSDVVTAEAGAAWALAEGGHILGWPSDVGEDVFTVCEFCAYRAAQAAARSRVAAYPETPRPLEKAHTPGKKTIAEAAGYLGVEHRQAAKVVFYESDVEGRLVVVLIRGDIEVNETKLARLIGVKPTPAREATIASVGAVAGYASPMGLDRARCHVLVDRTVAESGNLICGANEPDYHLRNFNFDRDLPGLDPVDVALAKPGDTCPICENTVTERTGFPLAESLRFGPAFAESLRMTFTAERGEERAPFFARLGIGLGRLASVLVEAHHDAYGPQWPVGVAPWKVHLIAIKPNQGDVRAKADALYKALTEAGIDSLYDDRGVSPGVQFADADLLGAPIRFTLSEKNLAVDGIEFKRRDTGEKGTIPFGEAADAAKEWIGRSGSGVSD